MDIYKYIAENHHKRFVFYFTFKPKNDYIINYKKDNLNSEIHIYDIFPEPYSESIELDDILSVITSNGSEMFIPSGMRVNMFGVSRMLFELKDNLETP